MAPIQILRSYCKLAFKYVIAEAGSEIGVSLGAKVGSGSEEPGLAESDLLEVSPPWAVASLPWAIVSLGATSSSGSLGEAESDGRFFCEVVILKWSRMEKFDKKKEA